MDCQGTQQAVPYGAALRQVQGVAHGMVQGLPRSGNTVNPVSADVIDRDGDVPRQKVGGKQPRTWASREEEYAMRYGDTVRVSTREERRRQGLPAKVEVVW